MLKLTKNQEQIAQALEMLPDEVSQEEIEAIVCSIISGYLGFEDVSSFLLYLHLKTHALQKELMEQAKKETKH